MQVDVTTFALWLGANLQHQPTTAQAYRDRFRAEFVPAFDRWLAGAEPPGTLPLGTPFQLPQYRPEYMTKAEELNRQADAAVAEGRAANQHSDNFMFSVVMFSSVIFLAGLDQDPASPHFVLRWAVAALASIMLVVSLVFMLRLPVDLG
jgi:hypothetical protein